MPNFIAILATMALLMLGCSEKQTGASPEPKERAEKTEIAVPNDSRPEAIRKKPQKLGNFENGGLHLSQAVTLDLVKIPPGTFWMGSPNSEEGRDEDELRHEVAISKPFYIGKYEVKQREYEEVMGSNPSYFKGSNLPVEQVSRDSCLSFCEKVSQQSGVIVRLPTEAEWEYACRGGTETTYYTGNSAKPLEHFDDNSALGIAGWYANNVIGIVMKHPCGKKVPNQFGLYDMHGYLWEWCQDKYSETYYYSSPKADPKGAVGGQQFVIRGGSFRDAASKCRSAERGASVPSNAAYNVGFRIVVEIP